jgi:hypothetical protein
MYPMLGGTPEAQSINFIDPDKYRLDFHNTVHTPAGVEMNGTSSYADTGIYIDDVINTPVITAQNAGYGFTCRYLSMTEEATFNADIRSVFGISNAPDFSLEWRSRSKNYGRMNYTGFGAGYTLTGTGTGDTLNWGYADNTGSSRGLLGSTFINAKPDYAAARGSTNSISMFTNNATVPVGSTSFGSRGTKLTGSILLGASRNAASTPVNFSKLDCGFGMVGTGMSGAAENILQSYLKTLLTALGKYDTYNNK